MIKLIDDAPCRMAPSCLHNLPTVFAKGMDFLLAINKVNLSGSGVKKSSLLLDYVIGLFTIPKYLSQKGALKISAILGIIFTIA